MRSAHVTVCPATLSVASPRASYFTGVRLVFHQPLHAHYSAFDTLDFNI